MSVLTVLKTDCNAFVERGSVSLTVFMTKNSTHNESAQRVAPPCAFVKFV